MAKKSPPEKPKKKFPALKPTPIVEQLCAPLVGIMDAKSLIGALKDVATNLHAAGLDALELAVAKDYVARILKEQKLVHSPGRLVGAAFRQVTPKKMEGQDVIPPDPDPWPEPVDGAALLTEMRDRFVRYLVLPPMAAEHCALDCLRTHVYDAFEHNPFHVVSSPVLGYGKTRLLAIKRGLVRRAPAKLIATITGPALARLIDKDHPSVLLDEGDALEVSQKFRAILDSCHTKTGASIAINVPTAEGGWNYRDFSTWAPLSVALIGHLHATVMSRGIETPMKKRLPLELVAPFGPKEEEELLDLKRQCIRWGQDHLSVLRHAPAPAMPKELVDDRAQDCWRGMLAIADECGEPWPTLARDAAVALSGGERDDASLGITLLRALRDVFGDRDQLPSEYILRTLNADEDGPWAGMGKKGITGNDVARLLRGFIPKRDNNLALNWPKDDWAPTWGPYRAKAKGFKRVLFTEAWARNLTDPVLPVLLKDPHIQGVPHSQENGHGEKENSVYVAPPSVVPAVPDDPMSKIPLALYEEPAP